MREEYSAAVAIAAAPLSPPPLLLQPPSVYREQSARRLHVNKGVDFEMDLCPRTPEMCFKVPLTVHVQQYVRHRNVQLWHVCR
jgi:hypothetical protein